MYFLFVVELYGRCLANTHIAYRTSHVTYTATRTATHTATHTATRTATRTATHHVT